MPGDDYIMVYRSHGDDGMPVAASSDPELVRIVCDWLLDSIEGAPVTDAALRPLCDGRAQALRHIRDDARVAAESSTLTEEADPWTALSKP